MSLKFNPEYGKIGKAVAILINQFQISIMEAYDIAVKLWEAGYLNYDTPDCCVDALVFDGNDVIIITRADGSIAPIGGFMESHDPLVEEMLQKYGDVGFEVNGQKESYEEANAIFSPKVIIGESSRPGRDKRLASVPTVLLAGTCSNPKEIKAGDDAVQAEWIPLIVNGYLNEQLLSDRVHADHRVTFQMVYKWIINNRVDENETASGVLERVGYISSPLSNDEIIHISQKQDNQLPFIQESLIAYLKEQNIENAKQITEEFVKNDLVRSFGQYNTADDAIVIKGNNILVQLDNIDSTGDCVLPGTFLLTGENPESFDDAIRRCLRVKYGLQVETIGPIVRAASGFHGDPRLPRNVLAKIVFITDQELSEPNVEFGWMNINELIEKKYELGYDHYGVIESLMGWIRKHNHSAEFDKVTLEQVARKLI